MVDEIDFESMWEPRPIQPGSMAWMVKEAEGKSDIGSYYGEPINENMSKEMMLHLIRRLVKERNA